MTRKNLQDWYNNNNITYSEKERLNKIGVSNYDYHYLIDLEQILRCENWAKDSSKIRNKLDGRIEKIIFFTPNFNDSKPDASNYSCAIVTDRSDNNWVIVYRPSYVANIGDDVLIEKTSDPYEAERKLNGDYPITAIAVEKVGFVLSSWPHVCGKTLPSDAKNNPDKHILPLDIVNRGIHYGIYLGNKWVAHLPGGGEPTQFDTWHKFCNSGGSSSSSSSSSSSFFSSSSSGSGNRSISCYHPQISFKRKEDIIRHIAKAISYKYGRYSYNPATNNCEHLVRRWIFGFNESKQARTFSGALVAFEMVLEEKTLIEKMEDDSRKLDNLTSSYSDEKERIKQYIREAENSRSYSRSKYQIEQEKFQERIVVYPKDWCRVQ